MSEALGEVTIDPGDGLLARRYIEVETSGKPLRMMLSLARMTYGKVRLCIGPEHGTTYDDGYCYQDPIIGLAALATWNGIGDPLDGWHRQISTGRRRPDGDPTQEYQAW